MENGGAVYIPSGYFPFRVPGTVRRDAYDVVELGASYPDLVAALAEAARESGTEVLGFNQMSLADVCLRTSLPVRQAESAKHREYDEPFEILGSGAHSLLSAIESRGFRWTRGDRFYHITGASDKATALNALAKLFRRAHGDIETIGVGDGHNDAELLKAVDTPVIIRSRFAVSLKKAVPRAMVTNAPGPHGWNEAVLPLVTKPEQPLNPSGVVTSTASVPV